ncbi:MAG TPA: addiction module protein [Verrucomicrobiae bacterium]|nr:addiction module protein [Verrucomicrobiae bacterium]
MAEDISELSLQDRKELLARLIRGLEPAENLSPGEIEAEWDREISQRLEEIDSGKVKLISAEEVFAKIQARLDEAR